MRINIITNNNEKIEEHTENGTFPFLSTNMYYSISITVQYNSATFIIYLKDFIIKMIMWRKSLLLRPFIYYYIFSLFVYLA